MTFEYRDPTGELLHFRPAIVNAHNPTQAVAMETETGRPVYFAVDQLEEVIAGIRDTARTAAGQQDACVCGDPATPNVVHRPGAPCYIDETAAGQPADCPHPHCGSRSLPISTGEVVRCVLLAGHAGQCQSATEYPYVSWPNPSDGAWNPEAAR